MSEDDATAMRLKETSREALVRRRIEVTIPPFYLYRKPEGAIRFVACEGVVRLEADPDPDFSDLTCIVRVSTTYVVANPQHGIALGIGAGLVLLRADGTAICSRQVDMTFPDSSNPTVEWWAFELVGEKLGGALDEVDRVVFFNTVVKLP